MFIIPLVSVLIIFSLYQLKNKNRFGAVSFIISMYVIMGLCSVILYIFYDFGSIYKVELGPVYFLSVCLFIIFFGLSSYSDRKNNIILIENIKLLRWLELFQIVSSVFAILFFSPFVLRALTGNINKNRLSLSITQSDLGQFGLINTFASLVANLFVLSIALAFVNLMTLERGGSRLRASILLILSSVYIFYILAYVGRDGFVYWLFSFIFMYLIFKDYLHRKDKDLIVKSAFLITFPAAIAFFLITISRFEGGVLLSIFDYAGSQVFNFSDQYRVDAPATFGLLNFSQYIHMGGYLLGADMEVLDRLKIFDFYKRTGVEPWRFSTFVGAWYSDFKQQGTIIALLVLSLLMRVTLRRHARYGVFCFSTFLCFLVLSQIVLFGVFYYRQYTTAYAQVAIILIALSFRVFRRKNWMRYIVRSKS